MVEHARARGIDPCSENALDHEIAFVNYRMMAKTLGLTYRGAESDSKLGLLWRALRVLRKERYPAKLTALHALWFGALALSSRTQAERLMRLRFQRGQKRA
jgi:hypothetical protein